MSKDGVITIGNAWSRLETYSDKLAELAQEHLRYEDQAAIYRAAATGWGMPAAKTLLQRDGRFPSGLLRPLVLTARQQQFQIEIIDRRRCSAQARVLEDVDLSWLGADQRFTFQHDVVQTALQRVRGLLKLPTGAGKTQCAIALVQKVPGNWLFLVKSKDLLRQAADRYEEITGDKAGRIGDGRWSVERFTVATFQTLALATQRQSKRFESTMFWLANQIDGLIVDEAHTLPADSFYEVAMCIDAYWRFGLSATPLARSDKRGVFAVGALGPIIYELAPEQLIQAGVLARPHIRMVRCEQPHRADVVGDWRAIERDYIVDSRVRNELVVRMARQAAKPALVFVAKKTHGELLCDALRYRGIRAAYLDGTSKSKTRAKAIQQLRDGEVELLVTTSIFQDGVDIPELRSVIIASAGRSAIAAVQRVGRAARAVEGKQSCEIWDLYDQGNGSLMRQSAERARAYRKEGYAVEVVDLREQNAA